MRKLHNQTNLPDRRQPVARRPVVIGTAILLLLAVLLFAGSSPSPAQAGEMATMPKTELLALTCVTVSPDEDQGKDTYINQDKPSENKGDNNQLIILTETGKLIRSLIQFDVSSIPGNAVVASAELGLYVNEMKNSNVTVQAHMLTTAWNEMSATWVSPWSTAGGDYGPTIATAFMTEGVKNYYETWDVTSAVEQWVAPGGSNYGLILEAPVNAAKPEAKFTSNNHSDELKRPYLEVCYLPGITLTPDNQVQSTAGSTEIFAHTLTVGELTNEIVDLSAATNFGWPVTIYEDVDNNGSIIGDPVISQTPPLGPNESLNLLVAVDIPVSAPNGIVGITTVVAEGQNSGIITTARDIIGVGIPPFTEPVVDGIIDDAYIYNPNSTVQDFCSVETGETLARTFTTYDLNDPNYDNIYIVLEMDRSLVDNTYGDPPSLHPSWDGDSHSLGNMDGSDKAQFDLFDGNGNPAYSIMVDYVESGLETTPSGWGSGGITEGEGDNQVDGDLPPLNPAYFNGKTSLDYDLNTYCSNDNSCVVAGTDLFDDSPPLTATQANDPYIPVNPIFNDWEFSYQYEFSVDPAAFGASGFGGVTIPYTHVSPNKIGSNEIPVEPCTGTIGDRVWYDTNADATQDNGEPGINGVTVILYRDNGNGIFDPGGVGGDQPQDSQTTTGDGDYLFTGLGPDTYFVDVVDATVPNGYVITTNNDPYGPIDLDPGEDFLDADFGYVSPAEVAVTKVQTSSDPTVVGGIVEYTIQITNVGDTVIDILPLQDFYDPAYLQFVSASPAQTTAGGGIVTWDDLTTTLGNVASGNSVFVTVKFLALAPTSGPGSLAPLQGRSPEVDPITVDGLLDPDYNFIRRYTLDETDVPGNFYAYTGDNQCYYAFVVDRAFNDNVYADTNDPVNGYPDGDAYTAADGWDGHTYGNLDGSDKITIVFPQPVDEVEVDYIESDNGVYTAPIDGPVGSVGATSLLWNSANSGWATELPFEDYSPPYDYNNGVVYPPAPNVDYWEWHMIYEMSIPKSALGGSCIQPLEVSAHNSPNKEDEKLGKIGDRVWFDENADGVQQPNEVGIGNVLVYLYDSFGVQVRTTQTEPVSGYYIFSNLPVGETYRVVVDQATVPGGYVLTYDENDGTNDPDGETIVSLPNVDGAEHLTADFGFTAGQGAIGDRVWYDTDGNALQGPNEPGLNGVTVQLYFNGNLYDSQVTRNVGGVDGYYLFDGLPEGDYVVDVVEATLPNNVSLTTSNEPFPYSLGQDEIYLDADFGYRAQEDDKTCDLAIVDGAIDENGGTAPTVADDACTEIEPDGAIGNYVWIDENSDGFQDAGERGIPNVRVVLKDGSGNFIADTLTDANGGYLFDQLPEGNYRVEVDQTTLPSGVAWTGPHAGQVAGADFGNQNPAGYDIALGADEEDLSADFGFNWPNEDDGPATLGDRIWIDANGDGVQDDGEPGIGGITLSIYYDSNGDGVVDPNVDAKYLGAIDQNGNSGTGMTTTEPDGSYVFYDLPAGQYVIVVDNPPAGYTQTGDPDHFGTDAASAPPGTAGDNKTTIPVLLAPGDVFLNVDFGYQPDNNNNNGEIGDTVWLDSNGNGTLTPGEEGIEGVTVALAIDENNNGQIDEGELIATTTTDEDGKYLFTGLQTDDGDGDVDYLVTVTDTDNVLGELTKTDGPNNGANNNSQDDPYAVSLTPGNTSNLTADFGYTSPGTNPDRGIIGDTVWFDVNNSGTATPDAGEPGIEGIVMELYNPGPNGVPGGGDDVLLDTTTTNENGTYYFGNLPLDDGSGSADYFVKVADENFDPGKVLEGFANTYDPNGGNDGVGPVVTLTPAARENLDQDFSYYGNANGNPARIGNLLWEDLNANGVYEPNGLDGLPGTQDDEDPIGGVTIDLYRDLNGNGAVDPGEPLLNTTTTAATIVPGSYGSDGNYIFNGLPAGNYIVDVTDVDGVLNGYWHSLGTAGVNNNSQVDPYGVSVATGGENLKADFGYYVDPAAVGNYVWDDLNGNGIQDAGEPGIQGVDVTLEITYPDGTVTEVTTTTDGDGFYSFDNLLLDEDFNGIGTPATPGVGGGDEPYFNITVETPTGGTPTQINAPGSTDKDDSNDPTGTQALPIQGLTDVTAQPDPNDEDSNASYDFGYVFSSISTLGNYVWIDENADGFQDEGEPGIPNVVVELYDGTNTLVGTQTTDSDGGYLFSMLLPDNYTVKVDQTTLPDGLTWTGPHAGQVAGADFGNQDPDGYGIALGVDDENLSADFGFVWGSPNENSGTGAIGDTIWVDADGDGVQDDGEPGIGGVTVTIYTDPDGDGIFDTPFTAAVDQNGNTGTGTTTTEPDGSYIFHELPADQYVIVVTPPAGYAQTGDPDHFGADASTNPGEAGDNQTTTPIVLAPGDVFLNADFGYQPDDADNNGTIGDTIWLDADADGTRDAGEDGIPNVTVALAVDLNNNGVVDPGEIIATDTTDENGEYLFTGLSTDDGDGDVDYLVTVTDSDSVLQGLTKTNGANDGANDNSQDDPYAVSLTPASKDNLTADFGYTPNGQQPGLGLIGDTIWFDTNNSGTSTPDAGEPPIEGVVVELYSSGGTLLDTTTTDENGNYYFGGLPLDDGIGAPGADYYVKVANSNFVPGAVLEDFYNTYDPNGGNDGIGPVVTLTNAAKQNLDQDFSYYGSGPDGNDPVARIGNLVWEDRNANGVYEPNGLDGLPGTEDDEMPIAGVTVDLYRDLNGNGAVDPGEPLIGSTVTDASIVPGSYGADGNYIFGGLPGGDYVVDVTDKDSVLNGYWHSLGAADVDNNSQTDPYGVSVATGGENLKADFGYYVDPAALGNRVWIDANQNGIQDLGESNPALGLDGVPVTLTITYPAGAGTVVLVTVTDDTGYYSFDNLLLDEDYNIGNAGGNPNMPTYKIVFGTVPITNPITGQSLYTPTFTGMGNSKTDNNWDGLTPITAVPVQGLVDTTLQPDPNNESVVASYDAGFFVQPPTDMGDLPEPNYPTYLGNGGPAHIIGNLFMGADIDADNQGQAELLALGDDGAPNDFFSNAFNRRDDEDGITPVNLSGWSEGVGGGEIQVFVTDNSGTGAGGWLKGWFDLDDDGVFDIMISQAVLPGATNIVFDIPPGYLVPGSTVGIYARFRLFAATTEPATDYTGIVTNGEVEDYFWSFSPTAVTLRGVMTNAGTVSSITYMFLAAVLMSLTALVIIRQRRFTK